MKVVLFCGGQGLRLREFSESIPKPMAPIGYRPLIWHLMRYYAHYGHNDFILCLGWRGDAIKEYFLNYNECVSNDFTLDRGQVNLLGSDIHNWRITFVDTGQYACVGERLAAVRPFLDGETEFLANYSDGLSDLHLPSLIDFFHERQSIATFVRIPPKQSFHLADCSADGIVTRIKPIADCNLWMNGGFFVLRHEIFDYLQSGEELVAQPFERLIRLGKLSAYRHDGFWGCMDTFKEKQQLDDLYARGNPPWEVWRRPQPTADTVATPVAVGSAPKTTPVPVERLPPRQPR